MPHRARTEKFLTSMQYFGWLNCNAMNWMRPFWQEIEFWKTNLASQLDSAQMSCKYSEHFVPKEARRKKQQKQNERIKRNNGRESILLLLLLKKCRVFHGMRVKLLLFLFSSYYFVRIDLQYDYSGAWIVYCKQIYKHFQAHKKA